MQLEININKELGEKAEKVVEKYGITLNEAIRMFLENVADNGKLPFTIEETRKYSKEELIEKLQEAIGDKPLEEVDY